MTDTGGARPGRAEKPPFTPVGLTYRVEGVAVAAVAALLFMLAGFAWWWLLVLFVVFDISFVGYAFGNRTGAVTYNLVHSYAAPAILVAIYGLAFAGGISLWPLSFVAGCWLFHVGVDRALGYGPRPPR